MKWSVPARARYLVLALACAVVAGVLAHTYLTGLSRSVPVVVAARDFPAYTVIDPSLVKTVLLPAVAVHPTAVRRAAEAVGLVSLVPRAAGEQLLAASLVSGSRPGEYRASLAPEERALVLPQEVVLGGWLGVGRGDYLDLYVVVRGTSRCLAQGLEVLEIIEDGARSVLGSRPGPPAAVLLRVTPGLAEQVVLAAECGKLYFAVSGYTGVPVPTTGAWLEQLSGGGDGSSDFLWP
ncbi:MAG: Flp pilus assembly protein CpaB [Bacillota bacterium]